MRRIAKDKVSVGLLLGLAPLCLAMSWPEHHWWEQGEDEAIRNRFNGRILNRQPELRARLETALARIGYTAADRARVTEALIYDAYSGTNVFPKSEKILKDLHAQGVGRGVATVEASAVIREELQDLRPWSDEGKPIRKLPDLSYSDFETPWLPEDPTLLDRM